MTTSRPVCIPYQSSTALGHVLDWTQKNLSAVSDLLAKRGCLEWKQQPKVECRCCVVEDIKNACQFLEIPPELALKVKTGQVENLPVAKIVGNLYDKTFLTAVFQVKVCLCVENLSQTATSAKEKNPVPKTNVSEAKAKPSADQCVGQGSRLDNLPRVTKRDLGNEMIAVLKLKCADELKLKHNFKRHFSDVQKLFNEFNLSDDAMNELESKCTDLEQMFESPMYQDVTMSVDFFGFPPTFQSPVTMTSMVNALVDFRNRCQESVSPGHGIGMHYWHFSPTPIAQNLAFKTSCTGNPVTTPECDLDDMKSMYPLRVYLDGERNDLKLEGRYDLSEWLFKAINTSEMAVRMIKQINDPRTAVTTDAGVDGIKQKEEAFIHRLNELKHFVQGMKLRHTFNDYVHSLCLKLPEGDKMDLVLLGKTGSGKSSLGNSILLTDTFKSSGNVRSETADTNLQCNQIDGRTISVLDTPGFSDTRFGYRSKAIECLTQVISSNVEGYHALLLVIRYGERHTYEGENVIVLLERSLGQDVVRSHSICVVTGGDVFENEEKDKTFDDWCRDTGSDFLDTLFKDCQYRCVLVNNKTDKKDVKKTQLLRLMDMVDGIGSRYTCELFAKAKAVRDAILAEVLSQEREDTVLHFLDIVLADVTAGNVLPDEIIDNLNTLGNEVKDVTFRDITKINYLMQNIEIKRKPEANDKENCTSEQGDDETKQTQKEEQVGDMEETNRNRVEIMVKAGKEALKALKDAKADNDNKIHDKTKEATEDAGCFPACSTVQTNDGRIVKLEDVAIGDKVMAQDGEGKLFYDTVYMFGHRDTESFGDFIILNTAHQQVSVTGNHLVMCFRDGIETCLAARHIKLGDRLIVGMPGNVVEYLPVLNMSVTRKRGLIAPFLMSGTLLVEGVVMSCYVDIVSHRMAHNALWPLRQLYRSCPKALAFVNTTTKSVCVPVWARIVYKGISLLKN